MPGQGALANHAAWTGKGVQAQVNTIDISDEDVVSHFNPEIEQSKVLLYGSNITEIIPQTSKTDFNSNQTFVVSQDIDALGDVYLEMEFQTTNTLDVGEFALHRTLDKVEFKIGSTTWQTLDHADIYALLLTKLNSTEYSAVRSITNPDTGEPNYGPGIKPVLKPGNNLITFPLPIFTMDGGAQRAHLIAGSYNQSITIKLTYRRPSELIGTDVKLSGVRLYARQYILSNKERTEIKSNDIVKSIHLSQSTIKNDTAKLDSNDSNMITVDLDHFSLLASHLLITMESDSGDAFVETTNSIKPNILSASLKLNNSEHSSPLTGHFMKNLGAKSLGLHNNSEFSNISLVAGTPPAGNVDFRRDVYVFPIASKPYGSDGCPLNRFDSVKLNLKVVNFPGRVNVTAVGITSALYSKGKASLLYFS
jgi:hypothetical protein